MVNFKSGLGIEARIIFDGQNILVEWHTDPFAGHPEGDKQIFDIRQVTGIKYKGLSRVNPESLLCEFFRRYQTRSS